MNAAVILRVALWFVFALMAPAVAIWVVVSRKRKPFELLVPPALNAPEISKILFHPFAQDAEEPEGFEIIETPVDGAVLKSHLYRNADADAGDAVLFFHGNGEIAEDWFPSAREIAVAFKANLVIADYRGYGLSTGDPTYGNMLSDAEAVFDAVKSQFSRRVHVFGRSIGSAAAIHVAWRRNGSIASLVIDSGFAHIDALIERLGRGNVKPPRLPEGFLNNADKLKRIRVPTLFLHGVDDRLIPVEAARENFQAVITGFKEIQEIKGAGHNDTMLSHGYFDKVSSFLERAKMCKTPYGRCPRCGGPLDANGICLERDPPLRRPVFIDWDSFYNEGLLCAEFDLEILAPAKWAGKFLDRLPAKFEMGRYSDKHSPASGIPFCALNLEGHPGASSCSRRYLRFTHLPGNGFNVELLAENDCKVAGGKLKKGDSAVAKVGDTIEIAPNWVFKVVPCK